MWFSHLSLSGPSWRGPGRCEWAVSPCLLSLEEGFPCSIPRCWCGLYTFRLQLLLLPLCPKAWQKYHKGGKINWFPISEGPLHSCLASWTWENIMALGACIREYFLMADRKQITGQAGTRLAFFPFSLCYVWTSDPWDEAALSQGVSPHLVNPLWESHHRCPQMCLTDLQGDSKGHWQQRLTTEESLTGVGFVHSRMGQLPLTDCEWVGTPQS